MPDISPFQEELRQAYRDAEERMIAKVAKRLARGINEPGWAEKKLAEIRMLEKELGVETKDLAKLNPQMAQAVTDGYEAGGKEAARSLISSGLHDAAPTGKGAASSIKTLVGKTTDSLDALHVAVVRRTKDEYRSIVGYAAQQQTIGVLNRREAVQLALNQFADTGISGFVDKAGRHWGMTSYANMAVGTAVHQAANEGHLAKLTANGQNLVIISDSPHECPLCRPWEGKVLRIGESPMPAEAIIPSLTSDEIALGLEKDPDFLKLAAVHAGIDPEILANSMQWFKSQTVQETVQALVDKPESMAALIKAHPTGYQNFLRVSKGEKLVPPVQKPKEPLFHFSKVVDDLRLSSRETVQDLAFAVENTKNIGGDLNADLQRKASKNLAKRLGENSDFDAFLFRESKLTPEQWEKLSAVDKRKTREEGCVKLLNSWLVGSGGSPRIDAIQVAAAKEFNLEPPKLLHKEIETGNQKAFRAFIRAQYDETQQFFKDQGITHVEAFRGMFFKEPLSGEKIDEVKGVTLLKTDFRFHPMSSFSAMPDVAETYAETVGSKSDKYQVLVKVAIPRERVLSLATTGFGDAEQAELVLLGKPMSTVEVCQKLSKSPSFDSSPAVQDWLKYPAKILPKSPMPAEAVALKPKKVL